MSFQDEINEIRAKKLSDAQSSSASRTERNRQACEPYIEWICERTREELKASARDGKIRYQEKDTYRYDLYGNSELLTEEKTNPHYCSSWCIRCEIDFTSDTFLFDNKQLLFQINEVSTLLYLLEQVELRLSKDGIVPVDYQETKRDNFFLKRKTQLFQCKKCHILETDSCKDLQKIQSEHRQGRGDGIYTHYLHFALAHFIPPER